MKKFKFNKVSIIVLAVMFTLGLVGTVSVFAFASPATVDLGTAANFTILSKTAVSTTGATSVTGDVGVSPAAAVFLTGFSQTMDASNKFSTSTYVTGKLYAADYTAPTPSYTGTAVVDMEAAYVDAMGRALPDATNFNAGNLGGQNLAPGLYKWTTGVTIPTNLTLTAVAASDVWIFQIDGNLDIASATSVILAGGALPSNIFWAVAGTTTLNTTSIFEGNILAGPGTSTIAMLNGATLHGKALGQKDVTLINNTISSTGGATPLLTVTKVVVNDDGENNVIADFPLFVGALPVTSGASNSFATGTYAVTETTNSNYVRAFSGDCDINGNITLFPGDNATCIITNDDIHRSSGSSGGGTVYGCKDPTATNYNFFSSSKPSLCTYASDTAVVTSAPVVVVQTPVVTPTPVVAIPKLPKTGFPDRNSSPWYMTLFSDILNLIK